MLDVEFSQPNLHLYHFTNHDVQYLNIGQVSDAIAT